MTLIGFSHERFGNIRGLLIDDEPWFVGKDVATALLYADTFGALKKHVPAKFKKVISVKSTCKLTFISKAGLCRLVLHSNFLAVEEFTDWICETVLPTIHETGKFAISSENVKQIIH